MDINSRQRKPSKDGWAMERVLGSGSFGTVTLYENKITKEKIAVKQCRLELNVRNRHRWQQEVDIMKSLEHPNIVAAMGVPVSIDVQDGELPLLAMEFCSGGDLRKVLSAAENSCGLKERTILAVASDLGAAIDFLHSQRIIHRDLKPENVVIKHEGNKISYKLIDLGYAKQLDHSSLATTFVGTLKYLAPELLDRVQYTKTVDYWSFGTLLFECITGSRPFLPDSSPVQWHKEVCKKAPDDICAYFDVAGEIAFSKTLPSPNSLSKPLQEKFVGLLRLLLLWDPKERGGPQNAGRTRQYTVDLQTIISTKILRVFCVDLCTLHSFEVSPSDRVGNIQHKLREQEPALSLEGQEFLTSSGEIIRTDEFALNFKSNTDEELTVFLLPKKEVSKPTNLIRSLPQAIHMIITEPKTLMPYKEQKKAFIQGLNFCHEQAASYRLMLDGYRAALLCLLKLNSSMGQLKSQMLVNVHKVETKQEFFKTSYETDAAHYRAIANVLPDDSLLRGWSEAEQQASVSRENDLIELKRECGAAQAEVLALQKSPFSNTSRPLKTNLDSIYERAVKLYEELKHHDRPDRRQAMGDCSKMTSLLLECLQFREKAHQALLTDLTRIVNCKRAIQAVLPKVNTVTAELAERCYAIGQMQRQRQDDIWKLLSSKLSLDSRASAASPLDLSTATRFPSLYTNPSTAESLVLLEESFMDAPGISQLVISLKGEQEKVQELDWGFLSEDEEEA